MKILPLAAALALALPAFAQTAQKIVADKSHIRFAFKQMNVPVEGRFRKFDATVAFDPRKPEATKAEFEVDLVSIDLGNAEGVRHCGDLLKHATIGFDDLKYHRKGSGG